MNVNKALITFIRVAFGVLLILLAIYAGTRLCSVGYDFGYRVFTEPAVDKAPGKDVMVQIKEGMSAKEIGELLEEKGLVRDAKLFYIQLKLSAYSKKIVPDIYTLNTSMTAKDMMVVMSAVEETESTEEPTEADKNSKAADKEGQE